jgi:hypothetical protein
MSMDARRIFQVSGVNDISHPRHRVYQVTNTQHTAAEMSSLAFTYLISLDITACVIVELKIMCGERGEPLHR